VECERTGDGIGILHTPFAMIVHGGMVVASAPIFDVEGKQELSDIVMTGTVSQEGALHVA
jgi:hypothetical protein